MVSLKCGRLHTMRFVELISNNDNLIEGLFDG